MPKNIFVFYFSLILFFKTDIGLVIVYKFLVRVRMVLLPQGGLDKHADRDQRSWIFRKYPKNTLPLTEHPISGDLRQGSSNNSVTNFVQGFPYVFQREKQPSFEGFLLAVLVILRRRSPTRFRPKVSLFNFAISEQYFRFSI